MTEVVIVDSQGVVAHCSPEIAARAIRRGEIARTGSPLVFRLTAQAAARDLPAEAKRRRMDKRPRRRS